MQYAPLAAFREIWDGRDGRIFKDEEDIYFFSMGLIAFIWVFDSRNFATTEFIYHETFLFSLALKLCLRFLQVINLVFMVSFEYQIYGVGKWVQADDE